MRTVDMLSDVSDTSTEDEDEGSEGDSLVESVAYKLLSEDEWLFVAEHLNRSTSLAALASTAKHMHLVINMTILSCQAAYIPDRQRAVDALARALYGGLAAGREPAVASALAAHVEVGVPWMLRSGWRRT